ncbi:MAG: M55 family metallopeptidase [Halanaerobiales bacterium]
MKKQLVLISDMEGVSGIFDEDNKQLINGGEEWRKKGREKMTSDVLAVCNAANEFGIDQILYYDAHYAGNPEFNVILDKLPSYVNLFDVPDRKFYWRRIRGQAKVDPFGLITVGQHARNGEKNAYFPHTLQTPPIKGIWLNDIHIAELGMAVLSFQGVKYIANIGCEASRKEAKELSQKVKQISVKDKSKKWEPSIHDTYPVIKNGVLKALKNVNKAEGVIIDPPYNFKLEVCNNYYFEKPNRISWKGNIDTSKAFWEAPSVEIGLEIFNYVRDCIHKYC